MSLHRIVYKSRATVVVDLDVVLAIARESEARNNRLGITGLLLATDTHFFQALEGEERRLMRVYARIQKDARHTGLTILSQGPVEQRQFEGWGLKGVGLMGLDDALAERLRKRWGLEGQELRFPDSEPEALAFLDEVRGYLR